MVALCAAPSSSSSVLVSGCSQNTALEYGPTDAAVQAQIHNSVTKYCPSISSVTHRERKDTAYPGGSFTTLKVPLEWVDVASWCDYLIVSFWTENIFTISWYHVLLSTSAACSVCPQRWQAESGVLGALLVTMTILLFGKNYVFKRQRQKSSFQNNDLFSSQTFLESL